ncbi:hypothetical protein K504DRAFT_284171 [Pleomassaria siparia CBS 279.74]|uniref:Uncharacterized protein n=1 Tax=Pleomassaria siparia CBS 279.74 TaxID=1314801 RepID=A0A6G1JP79_9PLEO|nr:hypothetical protein K504DRAFT_284171 [Pleomassaria siparia CBS 279.74]
MIYQFPPSRVGSVLVWYLWLVRPFLAVISHTDEEEGRTSAYYIARSPWLWPTRTGGQHTDSKTFARSLARTTEQHLGHALGPATLRHLLTAFARRTESRNDQRPQALSPEDVKDCVKDCVEDCVEQARPATAMAAYATETVRAF